LRNLVCLTLLTACLSGPLMANRLPQVGGAEQGRAQATGTGPVLNRVPQASGTEQEHALQVFDLAFGPDIDGTETNPVVRPVNRADGVCILALDSGRGFQQKAEQIVGRMSQAFDLDLDVMTVRNMTDCVAAKTAYFVLLASNPGDAAIREVLGEIAGSPPPKEIGPFDGVLGMSLSLPGTMDRDFLFVDTTDDPAHADNRHAIFVEELLQSMLRAPDIPSETIVSVLGESYQSTDYSEWYNHNPRGLCRVDVILLELLVGKTPLPDTLRYRSARETLDTQYDVFRAGSDKTRALLEPDIDPRCW